MKKEIIGILICMLLIATAIPVLGTIKEEAPHVEQSNLSLSIEITAPVEGDIYFMGNFLVNLPFLSRAWILGKITFTVNVVSELQIECVDWYVDGTQEAQFTSQPYDWTPPMPSGFPGKHEIRVEVIDFQSNKADDTVLIIKFG